jgi:hypothetical protein
MRNKRDHKPFFAGLGCDRTVLKHGRLEARTAKWEGENQPFV